MVWQSAPEVLGWMYWTLHWRAHIARKRREDFFRGPRTPLLNWCFVVHPVLQLHFRFALT